MKGEFQYCYQCGGHLTQQRVTKIHTWKGKLVSVIENVPAWVCDQCGEKYYDGPVLERIEELLKQKPQPKRNLSVPAYEF